MAGSELCYPLLLHFCTLALFCMPSSLNRYNPHPLIIEPSIILFSCCTTILPHASYFSEEPLPLGSWYLNSTRGREKYIDIVLLRMVQFLLLVNHPNNHIALAVNCYLSYCNLWSNNCNFLANCNFVCISHIHTLFTSINDEIGSPMDPLIFCFALLLVVEAMHHYQLSLTTRVLFVS